MRRLLFYLPGPLISTPHSGLLRLPAADSVGLGVNAGPFLWGGEPLLVIIPAWRLPIDLAEPFLEMPGSVKLFVPKFGSFLSPVSFPSVTPGLSPDALPPRPHYFPHQLSCRLKQALGSAAQRASACMLCVLGVHLSLLCILLSWQLAYYTPAITSSSSL